MIRLIFFSLGYIPAPKTIYKNLHKVLPSEIITIKDFKIKKERNIGVKIYQQVKKIIQLFQ